VLAVAVVVVDVTDDVVTDVRVVDVVVDVVVTEDAVVCVVVRVDNVGVVTDDTVVAVLTVVLVVAVRVVRDVCVVVVLETSHGSTAGNTSPLHDTLKPSLSMPCIVRAAPAPSIDTINSICVPPMHKNVTWATWLDETPLAARASNVPT